MEMAGRGMVAWAAANKQMTETAVMTVWDIMMVLMTNEVDYKVQALLLQHVLIAKIATFGKTDLFYTRA